MLRRVSGKAQRNSACPGAHRNPASGGACPGAGHASSASADGVISSRGAISFSEPEWRGFDIRRALEIRLGLPVLYNNDANAAALYAHYSQVSSARSECLDWLLIRSERHLVRVLPDIEHYNHARPHRSRDLRPPCASAVVLHGLRRLSASVSVVNHPRSATEARR